jgi:hypothetical protein
MNVPCITLVWGMPLPSPAICHRRGDRHVMSGRTVFIACKLFSQVQYNKPLLIT